MHNYLKRIYEGKRVLITGCTGFKGSWLSLWLNMLGADVIGYALDPPTEPNLFTILDLRTDIKYLLGNVSDYDKLISVFEIYQPEFVFHLAAQPLVQLSYEHPRLTFDTNVMGTVNILESVRHTGSVRVCVVITSDKCYENKEWIYGYRENDPMGGYDPYSSSKGCAELVTSAYRSSFFNPNEYGMTHEVSISSARAGNVIGGGDWGRDRIIPDCIRSLSNNQGISIRNSSARRPWQYVLEPLYGYLLLGGLMSKNGNAYSSAWNFGPNDANIISVKELVDYVINCWGTGSFSLDNLDHPHEANLLKLDISKARAILGWMPIYDVYEAITRTVKWYKAFYNSSTNKEISELTLNEIRSFENAIHASSVKC